MADLVVPEADTPPVTEQAWILKLAEAPLERPGVVALVVVFGPVAEEVFFRGYVFVRLRKAARAIPAYVFSSLLFAVFHFNPTAIPSYALLGAAMAYGYEKTGRLATPITMHCLDNLAALTLLAAR